MNKISLFFRVLFSVVLLSATHGAASVSAEATRMPINDIPRNLVDDIYLENIANLTQACAWIAGIQSPIMNASGLVQCAQTTSMLNAMAPSLMLSTTYALTEAHDIIVSIIHANNNIAYNVLANATVFNEAISIMQLNKNLINTLLDNPNASETQINQAIDDILTLGEVNLQNFVGHNTYGGRSQPTYYNGYQWIYKGLGTSGFDQSWTPICATYDYTQTFSTAIGLTDTLKNIINNSATAGAQMPNVATALNLLATFSGWYYINGSYNWYSGPVHNLSYNGIIELFNLFAAVLEGYTTIINSAEFNPNDNTTMQTIIYSTAWSIPNYISALTILAPVNAYWTLYNLGLSGVLSAHQLAQIRYQGCQIMQQAAGVLQAIAGVSGISDTVRSNMQTYMLYPSQYDGVHYTYNSGSFYNGLILTLYHLNATLTSPLNTTSATVYGNGKALLQNGSYIDNAIHTPTAIKLGLAASDLATFASNLADAFHALTLS